MAKHFQYKIEVFFKKIILDGPLGKTKYYAIRIEFRERGGIWIFNAPDIENEVVYTDFIEKTINAQLPDHLYNLELFELVKTYQVHVHSRICWKYNKNEGHFSSSCHFTEEKIIAKPSNSKFSNEEKQEILTWGNTLLRQLKSYIDNNLNHTKENVLDPTKDNFTHPVSVKEILDELDISKNDYYRPLSISKDEGLELHLKRT